jgi:hypothetical protein
VSSRPNPFSLFPSRCTGPTPSLLFIPHLHYPSIGFDLEIMGGWDVILVVDSNFDCRPSQGKPSPLFSPPLCNLAPTNNSSCGHRWCPTTRCRRRGSLEWIGEEEEKGSARHQHFPPRQWRIDEDWIVEAPTCCGRIEVPSTCCLRWRSEEGRIKKSPRCGHRCEEGLISELCSYSSLLLISLIFLTQQKIVKFHFRYICWWCWNINAYQRGMSSVACW